MKAKGLQPFFFTSSVELAEGGPMKSEIEVLRVGVIRDRGLRITKGMLEDYVRNFKENVYGTRIQVNIGHNRGGQAAGWVEDLTIKGDSLMATVEWTELGAEQIRKKLYLFVSSELAPQHPHADTGKTVSNVFIGVALTNVPALKHQQPIVLSEDEADRLINDLPMLKKYLEELSARLKAGKAVTDEDIAFARTNLSEMPQDEQAELKETLDTVELAVKEAKKKKKTGAAAEGDGEPDGDEPDEEEMMAERKKTAIQLSESAKKIKLLEETLAETNKKLARQELSSDIEETLMLSSENGIELGFVEEDLGTLTGFMESLNEDQRATFKELVGKVRSVDFSTIGGSSDAGVGGTDMESKVVALADKLFDEKKGDMAECQKLAMKQLGVKSY